MNRLQEIRARVVSAHQNYESVRHYSESRPLPGHWIYGYGAHGTGDANVKADIPYLLSLVERLAGALDGLHGHMARTSSPDTKWELPVMVAARAALTAVEEKK